MANYVLSTYDITDSNAVVTDNPSVEWQQTTATDFVTPTWSSINRAVSPTDALQNNFNFADIEKSIRGFIHGRRPVYNLKFPRGYYNK